MYNLILAVLMATNSASFPTPKTIQPDCVAAIQKAGPPIKIKVRFGNKRCGCDCGFAICQIEIRIEKNSLISHNSADATAVINEKGNLSVLFEAASMDKETIKKYFGSGFFILEEDYTLEAEVAEQLGVTSHTIKAGKYKSEQTGEGFIVNF